MIYPTLSLFFIASIIRNSFAQEKELSFGERLVSSVKGVLTHDSPFINNNVQPIRSLFRLETSKAPTYVPGYLTASYYASTTCSGNPTATFSDYLSACTSSGSVYTQTFIDLSNYVVFQS